MPIYAYRCESCGFEKDVLQKISDAHLTQCPSCGADTFRKQVTAAGFQLKGSGWYVTDFRGGNTASNSAAGKNAAATGEKAAGEPSSGSGKPAGESTATNAAASTTGTSTAPSTAGAT